MQKTKIIDLIFEDRMEYLKTKINAYCPFVYHLDFIANNFFYLPQFFFMVDPNFFLLRIINEKIMQFFFSFYSPHSVQSTCGLSFDSRLYQNSMLTLILIEIKLASI